MTTEYRSVAQVLDLHRQQLRAFRRCDRRPGTKRPRVGGRPPAATFAGEDLYPDLAAKAAALMHAPALNHPFVDGNKHVGTHAALVQNLAGQSLTEGSAGRSTVAPATRSGRSSPRG